MNLRTKFGVATWFVQSVLILFPVASRADVIRTFDLSGGFVLPTQKGNQTYLALSGTVTIDTTVGTILYQTSFPPVSAQLPVVLTQGFDSTAQSYFLNVYGQIFASRIYFDTPSLVNYAGGYLGSLANPTPGGLPSSFGAQLAPLGIVLGFGTALIEPVPEPGSLLLLGGGIAALAFFRLSRRGRDR